MYGVPSFSATASKVGGVWWFDIRGLYYNSATLSLSALFQILEMDFPFFVYVALVMLLGLLFRKVRVSAPFQLKKMTISFSCVCF